MKFYVEIPISQNALELPPEKCENQIPFPLIKIQK